jgi:hypothetical protein
VAPAARNAIGRINCLDDEISPPERQLLDLTSYLTLDMVSSGWEKTVRQ